MKTRWSQPEGKCLYNGYGTWDWKNSAFGCEARIYRQNYTCNKRNL